MVLPTPQVDQFYRMWRPLLNFVNAELQIFPSLSGAGAKNDVDVNLAVKVRDTLWEKPEILDRFIEKNPAQLPSEDLAILRTWRYRRQGDFIIYKVLKKHSIFFSQDKTDDVFAVKGLYSPFDDIFGPYLPVMVKTVLLPFNDVIIADGLFESYNVSFGPGIRSQFKTVYENAKELWEIITTLLPDREPPSRESQAAKVEAINTKILDAFQKHQYKSGLSPKTVERDFMTVQSFVQSQLSQQAEPTSLRELEPNIIQNYLQSMPDKDQKTASLGLKRFIVFLRDTERIDWDKAENLLDRLKRS